MMASLQAKYFAIYIYLEIVILVMKYMYIKTNETFGVINTSFCLLWVICLKGNISSSQY